MTKSCNDTSLNKFRVQLREYIDYYSLVCGARSNVEPGPMYHLIWPGKKKGVDNIYELHERNVTDLMENRAKLGRLMWFCHLRMQLIPGAILRCPRNDLTRDILWDDALSEDAAAPVPTEVLYSMDENGLSLRLTTYVSGITRDNQPTLFTVQKRHVDHTKESWPDGVKVAVERRVDSKKDAA